MFKKIGHQGVIIIVSVLLSLFFYIFPITSQVGEMWMYDRRLDLLRSPKFDKRLQFVSIDDLSLEKCGAFPWKRSAYSILINKLKKYPPKILIFDIFFLEPKSEDKIFADAIKNADFPVVLSYIFTEPTVVTREENLVPVVKKLANVSPYQGFTKNALDADKKVRRGLLAKKYKGRFYPSISLASYALLKGVDLKDIKYEKNKIIVGDTVIKTDNDYSIYIDYCFPEVTGGIGVCGIEKTIPSKSFVKCLKGDNSCLKDKIVIIGAGAVGMRDDFPTPVNDRTYGGIIHLNIINTLLRGNFLVRVPNWVNIIVLLGIAFLYGGLISKFYKIKNIVLFSLGLLVLFTILNLYLFKIGYWLYLLPPILTIFSCTLVILAVQFFRTHKLFRQFVVPEVADKMVSSDEHSELGAKEMEVSILFSDIRGYTSLSENMTPTQVVEMLNEYHAEMVEIFEKHHGRVVDYMGDAQLVIFGAPIERKDHALCACKAAIETQDALKNLCKKWHVENRTSFEVGIGICTGNTSIGLVGAEGHKQFTAIGDTTNVASRLQGQSKVLGAPIILSPLTAEYVKDEFEIRYLGAVPLKGKSEPMRVFTMDGPKKDKGKRK